MTEAEALDMAARAAGWRDWKTLQLIARPDKQDDIRRHAKTIMENAALEAKLADVSKALMATAEAAASSAKKAVEAADRLEALEAENERLRDLLCLADELLMEAKGAFPLPGNPLRPAYLKIREVSGDDYTTRKSRARAALKEIEGD